MSIENLKKILESERKENARLWAEFYQRPMFANGYEDAYFHGHEAATNRLLPLLQKAVEMAEFYGDKRNWLWSDWDQNMVRSKDLEIMDKSESITNYGFGLGGKKAREFLAELTKMTEIKKESGE